MAAGATIPALPAGGPDFGNDVDAQAASSTTAEAAAATDFINFTVTRGRD